MAWAKTEAGRLEMQTRSLVNARAQRNLLLLIDGKRTQEQLLASVVGVTAADFAALRDLGLISSPDHPAPTAPAPVTEPVPFPSSTPSAMPAPVRVDAAHSRPAPLADSPPSAPTPLPGDHEPGHIDIPIEPRPAPVPAGSSFDQISKTLTSLIASELGLRGFTLTLAVERASGIDALLEVADRVVAQIEHRKGGVAADKARRALFGR